MKQQSVRLDPTKNTVTIESLTLTDEYVAREAARWTTGVRGEVVTDDAVLSAADVTNYIVEAVSIGAHALAFTGQTVEARAVDQLLKDVGTKTTDATSRAAEATEHVVREAADAVTKATAEARKALTEAERKQREELRDAVKTAKGELTAEIRRLFGGESPELVEKLQPLLKTFGTRLDENVRVRTTELIEKAAKQFDPSDPTSPMAKHTAAITAEQAKLAAQFKEDHAELTRSVDELTATLKIKQAQADLTKVTPIKGGAFEDQVNRVLEAMAVGLGDDYAVTRNTVGRLPNCKKGDGVLTVSDGDVRLVVEVTDSGAKRNWTEYFDLAERNRDAVAALGIVRSVEQNAGQTVRMVGHRRFIVAFDPDRENAELLRTVLLLLRTAALAAVARTGTAEIQTAKECILEAVEELARLDSIKKLSASIQKGAGSIDTECTKIGSSIHRLLDEAIGSLEGARAADRGAAAELGAA